MLRTGILSFLLSMVVSIGAAQSIIMDTVSYSLGQSTALRLKNQGANQLNYTSFIQAMKDVLEGAGGQLTREYSDSLNFIYFQNQKEIMFTKIKEEGEAFLKKNAERPEVTVTESGLQYEVLTSVGGFKPSATNTVTVHYEGMLLNGQLFDSSVARGEPATFPLNRVIAGWTEGLQLMSVGSKYRFFLPQELAYGSRGAGADIPPYSALIFDVELLGFQ